MQDPPADRTRVEDRPSCACSKSHPKKAQFMGVSRNGVFRYSSQIVILIRWMEGILHRLGWLKAWWNGGRNHLSTGARFRNHPPGKIGQIGNKMMTHTNPTGWFTIHRDVPSIFGPVMFGCVCAGKNGHYSLLTHWDIQAPWGMEDDVPRCGFHSIYERSCKLRWLISSPQDGAEIWWACLMAIDDDVLQNRRFHTI